MVLCEWQKEFENLKLRVYFVEIFEDRF